jgi:hypothetical protein
MEASGRSGRNSVTKRLVVLLIACGLVGLWTYPQIATTYSSWSNEERKWIPFKTVYERTFLTNAAFGTQPDIRVTTDERLWEMIRTKAVVLPNAAWGYHVQKQVGINWPTQLLQSALIVLFGTGFLWVASAK